MKNIQDEFGVLVSQAILHEIANTVGRKLASAYAAGVSGISHESVGSDVQFRLHATGPYRDITMRFAEPVSVCAGFDDVEDHEL